MTQNFGKNTSWPIEILFSLVKVLEFVEIDDSKIQYFTLGVKDNYTLEIEHREEGDKNINKYYISGDISNINELVGMKLYIKMNQLFGNLLVNND